MLVKRVFVCACHNRFGQRQLCFRAAGDADNLHAVHGLCAKSTHVADGHAGLAKTAAGYCEMIGRCRVSTQLAV